MWLGCLDGASVGPRCGWGVWMGRVWVLDVAGVSVGPRCGVYYENLCHKQQELEPMNNKWSYVTTDLINTTQSSDQVSQLLHVTVTYARADSPKFYISNNISH